MDNIEQSNEQIINLKFRVIGAFFILAFGLYGGGTLLQNSGQQAVGLLLILMNSAVVIAIGVLARITIGRDTQLTANIYLAIRIGEGLLLGIGGIVSVLGLQAFNGVELNAIFYRLAMITLGLGSISFCRWLLVTKRIPSILAWLGLIGYPLMALSMVAEFFNVGMLASILLVPGAVFELIFGLTLIFMGLGNFFLRNSTESMSLTLWRN